MTSLHGFKMDKQLSERYESQVPSHTSNENLAIAIYDSNTNNNIINSVNWLFKEMNLVNIEYVSAYRTPTRPGMSRPGVVIAEMRCLRDKTFGTRTQTVHSTLATVPTCVYKSIKIAH